jgi:hypothetical protein
MDDEQICSAMELERNPNVRRRLDGQAMLDRRRKVQALIAGLQTSFDDPAERSSMNSRSP